MQNRNDDDSVFAVSNSWQWKLLLTFFGVICIRRWRRRCQHRLHFTLWRSRCWWCGRHGLWGSSSSMCVVVCTQFARRGNVTIIMSVPDTQMKFLYTQLHNSKQHMYKWRLMFKSTWYWYWNASERVISWLTAMETYYAIQCHTLHNAIHVKYNVYQINSSGKKVNDNNYCIT